MPRARTHRRRTSRRVEVSPEALGALLVRVTAYAAVAFVGAMLVHGATPQTPVPVAFALLLVGIALAAATRTLCSKGRAPPA
jgi:hypothetical protein